MYFKGIGENVNRLFLSSINFLEVFCSHTPKPNKDALFRLTALYGIYYVTKGDKSQS